MNGPSIYPNSGLGAVGWINDSGHDMHYRIGVFDGVPNDPAHPARTSLSLSAQQGALIIGEVAKSWGKRNRVLAGAWGYTAALPRLVNPTQIGHASVGAYALVEGTLLTRGDNRRLDGWIGAGVTNPTFNIISSYVGSGVVFHGLLTKPKDDSVGLAIAHADLARGMAVVGGGVAGAGVAGSGVETTFELTYQRRLRDWLTVQPDLQYVISPAGRSDVGNALVVGMRFIFGIG